MYIKVMWHVTEYVTLFKAIYINTGRVTVSMVQFILSLVYITG